MKRRVVILGTLAAVVPLRALARNYVLGDDDPWPEGLVEGDTLTIRGYTCVIDDLGDCVWPDALGGRRKRKRRVYAERRRRRKQRRQSR